MNWGNLLFSFNGRTGRKGFWLVMVAMLVIYAIIWAVALAPLMAAATLAASDPNAAAAMDPSAMSMPIWIWIVLLPMMWISLAVQAKRWHDQDKSAWWILIGFIPFIGGLIALIMCGFIAGTPGPNRFGDVPSV